MEGPVCTTLSALLVHLLVSRRHLPRLLSLLLEGPFQIQCCPALIILYKAGVTLCHFQGSVKGSRGTRELVLATQGHQLYPAPDVELSEDIVEMGLDRML